MSKIWELNNYVLATKWITSQPFKIYNKDNIFKNTNIFEELIEFHAFALCD